MFITSKTCHRDKSSEYKSSEYKSSESRELRVKQKLPLKENYRNCTTVSTVSSTRHSKGFFTPTTRVSEPIYTTVPKWHFTEMMETEFKTETGEQSHIAMEILKHDDFKTAFSMPAMLSEDYKFQSSNDGSELSSRITQSTKDIDLQLRCRLCAQANKCMIDIFSSDPASKNMPSMIHLCLLIIVKEMDALPKQVCWHCLEELERSYEFHQAVAKADEKLLAFERLASGNRGETDGHWATSPPCDRQHGPTGGTSKRNSNIEMSNGKSTNSLGELPTADITATKNVLSASLRPCTEVLSFKNNSSAKKDKQSSTDPKNLNPDSTTEAFDIGTTTASQIVQQSTSDSGVIIATCNSSEADARQAKKAKHKVNPAIEIQSDTGRRRYRCTTCAKTFSSKGNLVQHNEIHSDVRELYTCNLCSKMFSSKGNLGQHKKIHSDVRELYTCNLCSATYKSEQTLSNHQRLHTGNGYSCKYCPKQFATKTSRKSHYRVHTGERPFKCSKCEKAYSQSVLLSQHMEAAHSAKRDYLCSFCDESFKTLQTKKIHVFEKHTDKSEMRLYQCDHCKRNFKQKTHLLGHLNTCKKRY